MSLLLINIGDTSANRDFFSFAYLETQEIGESLSPSSSSSPQGVIRVYYHPPGALFSPGWVWCWQPLILQVQQERDYSSWGRGSGQVKAAEAPSAGEMGLGAEPGPSFTPQPGGSSTSMLWGAPLDGMGQRLGGTGTGKPGEAHCEAYRNPTQKFKKIITI